MRNSCCNIYTSKFYLSKRLNQNEKIISKNDKGLFITLCEDDSFEKFEEELNELTGNTSFYKIKKKISSTFISFISILAIMFAILSASIYEDLFKKIIFELPFDWTINDTIGMFFVLIFLFGLFLMPSILDGEKNEFKDILFSWFNKDIKKLRRVKQALSGFDEKVTVHIFNIELFKTTHWANEVLLKATISKFSNINLYVRNDQASNIKSKLNSFNLLDVRVNTQEKISRKINTKLDFLLFKEEKELLALMQLSSTMVVKKDKNTKYYLSLEFFEYCAKNFLSTKVNDEILLSNYQNFISRAFDDFYFLLQEDSMYIYLNENIDFRKLKDEQRRLSYYLRNHIEESIKYFDNPISLIILYYYVKDIVLNERRVILILESLIDSIYKQQNYELIQMYWFEIAGLMFDFSDFEVFESSLKSYYRKLSINSLDRLLFLFERNGYFNEALLLANYLYELNENSYAVTICSIYERMGQYDKAYNSLPKTLLKRYEDKPNDIEVRYLQRKAWIIVSQRKQNLKEEGLEALSSLKQKIFAHNKNNEPLWLWHYYNIKANYEEWQKDYEKAIQNYKKCLSIPALGSFEYGATFINMSIAYRFLYIQSPNDESNIEKSIKLGNIGVKLKQSVGDRDEMPVVLHNQALNLLYKILYGKISSNILNRCIKITDNAMDILNDTGSCKKLGVLLMESIISKELANINSENMKDRLKSEYGKIDDNESKQLLDIYKQFVKSNKIKKIDFLEKKL
ncbi:MAG: tetratricopeptide repeat protein [Campylobacterota bacterium]